MTTKPASVRTPTDAAQPSGGARHRFAVAGVALALAAGIGTPTIAGLLATRWKMPIELVLVGVGLLVAMAFLAAGWVLGRRMDKLSEEARRDPVTNVGNRRHWEESLAHEVARAARANMPLSLLMVDVDHLKELNDRGGHIAGDVALAVVGEVLNRTCRSRDVASRFGGDEFAILLPRTTAAEAKILAERIRTEISQRRRKCPPPLDTRLSVSIGICDLASLPDPRARLLFESADKALYTAKQSGRDCVEVYRQPPRVSSVIFLDEHRAKKNRKHL